MLSICIPTFNRSDCLAELLESICGQGTDDIEIIIGDDASTDDTTATVQRFQDRLAGIRYVRHETNIGLDRNFLFIVEQARSEYVWLMGDDDRLEPGALAAVLAQLHAWPAVCGLTLGVIDYDQTLRHPVGVRVMPDTAQFHGAEAVFGRIVELLGFMSATVVNRRMWVEACRTHPVLDYSNLYIQVYIIGCMLGASGTWGVLDVPCVGYRTANDQFLSSVGWFRRLEIDVMSYDQIFHGLFPGRPATIAAINSRVLATHVMARLFNAKSGRVGTRELLQAAALLRKMYGRSDLFWRKAVPALVTPAWLLRFARGQYQKHSPRSGTRRAKALRGEALGLVPRA